MKDHLRPTLWRTCRALAGRRRLRMLMILHEAGEMTVSQMAESMDGPLSEASESLRILNARGLLKVRRSGRYVYYSVGGDPTVPWTRDLLRAVIPALKSGPDGHEHAFKALTALTHVRRHHILYELGSEKMGFTELRKRTGISRSALKRHLLKLGSRGMVASHRDGYCRGKPRDLLRKTLLGLAGNSP